MKILIAGGPRTGKTTLANLIERRRGYPAKHTDDIRLSHAWGDDSVEVAKWIEADLPDWVIEGVTVPRAMRKWLETHPTGVPADRLILLTVPLEDRTPRQETMAKGVVTVLKEIMPELLKRGMKVEGADRNEAASDWSYRRQGKEPPAGNVIQAEPNPPHGDLQDTPPHPCQECQYKASDYWCVQCLKAFQVERERQKTDIRDIDDSLWFR